MKRYLIILLFLISQAAATVEDTSPGPESSMWSPATENIWPAPPTEIGKLDVSIELTGPESEVDRQYVSPGKTLEYIVTVKNEGSSEVDAELAVNLNRCRPKWFDWTFKSLTIPSNGARSQVLLVNPDMSAAPGKYRFEVSATATNCKPGSASTSFEIQDFDYISETGVGGTGQFQISKNVRSMNSGIKSNKDISFSGSVDWLAKNEYLVDDPLGRNPNFQECDAVDNYVALNPNDALFGSETVKSSLVFGGVGTKIQESYNLREMEFKQQDIKLHTTGSKNKRAEFQTANNFTGYYMIDAKQSIPGQKNIKERDEFLGSFEIQRRLIFKDHPRPSFPCFDDSHFSAPEMPTTLFN
ncbi:MAG: COG1470 family protein [Methanotrichaceae archaeon]